MGLVKGFKDGFDLGGFAPDVARVLQRLRDEKFAGRLMAGDASLWEKADEKLIEDSLGWLAMPHEMNACEDSIKSFAATVRDSGVKSVVLLGMGGSSLAPFVLKETFGSAPGYPGLTFTMMRSRGDTYPAGSRRSGDAKSTSGAPSKASIRS